MRKKVLVVLFAFVVLVAMSFTGCGGGGSSEESSGGGEGGTIRLCNNKVEVDKQYKELAAAYKEATGVTVEVESIGGGQDIQSTLKGYKQANNMPDIFCIEGDKDYPTWEGLLVDLSDQEWVKDTDTAYSVDGKVYGFPTTTEAIGLAYNKSILDKCGVDPESITSPAAMEDAFKKIDAKKDELGLSGVIGYCAEAAQLNWSTGSHLFATYIDSGLKRDDTTYIDLLNDGGKVKDPRFNDWCKMVGLFNKYSDPDLLVSGTYDQQVKNFAAGKYAFVTQGSWIGTSLVNDYKADYEKAGNFEVGMAPYAFEDGQETILTNGPGYWVLYGEGANIDAAKDFLNWCATDDNAQKILVEDCGYVPQFKSSKHESNDPFAATIAKYQAADKTSAWHWTGMKADLCTKTGVVFQDFAKGKYKNADDFEAAMKEAIEAYYAKG